MLVLYLNMAVPISQISLFESTLIGSMRQYITIPQGLQVNLDVMQEFVLSTDRAELWKVQFSLQPPAGGMTFTLTASQKTSITTFFAAQIMHVQNNVRNENFRLIQNPSYYAHVGSFVVRRPLLYHDVVMLEAALATQWNAVYGVSGLQAKVMWHEAYLVKRSPARLWKVHYAIQAGATGAVITNTMLSMTSLHQALQQVTIHGSTDNYTQILTMLPSNAYSYHTCYTLHMDRGLGELDWANMETALNAVVAAMPAYSGKMVRVTLLYDVAAYVNGNLKWNILYVIEHKMQASDPWMMSLPFLTAGPSLPDLQSGLSAVQSLSGMGYVFDDGTGRMPALQSWSITLTEFVLENDYDNVKNAIVAAFLAKNTYTGFTAANVSVAVFAQDEYFSDDGDRFAVLRVLLSFNGMVDNAGANRFLIPDATDLQAQMPLSQGRGATYTVSTRAFYTLQFSGVLNVLPVTERVAEDDLDDFNAALVTYWTTQLGQAVNVTVLFTKPAVSATGASETSIYYVVRIGSTLLNAAALGPVSMSGVSVKDPAGGTYPLSTPTGMRLNVELYWIIIQGDFNPHLYQHMLGQAIENAWNVSYQGGVAITVKQVKGIIGEFGAEGTRVMYSCRSAATGMYLSPDLMTPPTPNDISGQLPANSGLELDETTRHIAVMDNMFSLNLDSLLRAPARADLEAILAAGWNFLKSRTGLTVTITSTEQISFQLDRSRAGMRVFYNILGQSGYLNNRWDALGFTPATISQTMTPRLSPLNAQVSTGVPLRERYVTITQQWSSMSATESTRVRTALVHAWAASSGMTNTTHVSVAILRSSLFINDDNVTVTRVYYTVVINQLDAQDADEPSASVFTTQLSTRSLTRTMMRCRRRHRLRHIVRETNVDYHNYANRLMDKVADVIVNKTSALHGKRHLVRCQVRGVAGMPARGKRAVTTAAATLEIDYTVEVNGYDPNPLLIAAPNDTEVMSDAENLYCIQAGTQCTKSLSLAALVYGNAVGVNRQTLREAIVDAWIRANPGLAANDVTVSVGTIGDIGKDGTDKNYWEASYTVTRSDGGYLDFLFAPTTVDLTSTFARKGLDYIVTPEPKTDDGDDEGLSTGIIAVIVIAAFAVLAFFIIAGVCCTKRYNKEKTGQRLKDSPSSSVEDTMRSGRSSRRFDDLRSYESTAGPYDDPPIMVDAATMDQFTAEKLNKVQWYEARIA